jgi:hypothetical protein
MSEADAAAPDGGALSVDEAVELMTGSVEAEEPGAEGGEDDAPVADVDPPHFWSAEDKAAFAALPPELQETVLGYERNRDHATARTIQEAAEARNRVEAVASMADQMVERLDKLTAEAEAAFGQRWPGPVDWAALADEVGAEQAMRLKLQYDQDAEDLQRLSAAKQEAEAAGFQAYVAGEFEKLKTIEPELADPKHGAERRAGVVKFLADNGVPLDQIRHAGALEFALAYDAMRYRQARASYAQGAEPRARGRAGVVPGAAPTQGASQQRAAGAKARFAHKPSIDNAVAALLARG